MSNKADTMPLPGRPVMAPATSTPLATGSGGKVMEFKGTPASPVVPEGAKAPTVDANARSRVSFFILPTEVAEAEHYDEKLNRVVASLTQPEYVEVKWDNPVLGAEIMAGKQGAVIEKSTFEFESRDGTSCDVTVTGLGKNIEKRITNGDFDTNKATPTTKPLTLHHKELDGSSLILFAAYGEMMTAKGLERSMPVKEPLKGHYYVDNEHVIAILFQHAQAAKGKKDVFADASGSLVGIPVEDYKVCLAQAQDVFNNKFRMLDPSAVGVTIKSLPPARRLAKATATATAPAALERSTFRALPGTTTTAAATKAVAKFGGVIHVDFVAFQLQQKSDTA